MGDTSYSVHLNVGQNGGPKGFRSRHGIIVCLVPTFIAPESSDGSTLRGPNEKKKCISVVQWNQDLRWRSMQASARLVSALPRVRYEWLNLTST